jgi:hypothetical protein
MDRPDVLLETLRLAVPMHCHELRGIPPEQLREIAQQASTTVATHGDDLMFGGTYCAEAFNALARGLAVLALTAWGGVTFRGAHWCSNPTCSDPDAHHDQPTYPDTAHLAPPDPPPAVSVPTHGRT